MPVPAIANNFVNPLQAAPYSGAYGLEADVMKDMETPDGLFEHDFYDASYANDEIEGIEEDGDEGEDNHGHRALLGSKKSKTSTTSTKKSGFSFHMPSGHHKSGSSSSSKSFKFKNSHGHDDVVTSSSASVKVNGATLACLTIACMLLIQNLVNQGAMAPL